MATGSVGVEPVGHVVEVAAGRRLVDAETSRILSTQLRHGFRVPFGCGLVDARLPVVVRPDVDVVTEENADAIEPEAFKSRGERPVSWTAATSGFPRSRMARHQWRPLQYRVGKREGERA
jgi:hypothetical protein